MGEYTFPAFFSYRIPNVSPSFALSAPTPGPSTVKLALVSTAIERTADPYMGVHIFDSIKASPVLFQVPERITMSRVFIKRLKRMRGGEIGRAFATREYVHYLGPLRIFIEADEDADEILDIASKVKYFGTGDSLVFCNRISKESEIKKALLARPLKDSIKARKLDQDGLIFPLMDIEGDANFHDLNPYAEKRGQALVTKPYLFPIRLLAEGATWRTYESVKNL